MNLRRATAEDIPLLIELERASAEAAHWTELHYREAIGHAAGRPSRLLLVAERLPGEPQAAIAQKSALVGFLVARHLAPEWELENIVVAAAERHRGIGTQLLSSLLDHARETHSTSVFLEVRESNAAAQALYRRAGFQPTGRRKSYYANPLEDAILYAFSLI